MSYYMLYIDDSSECRRIQDWLQGLGIPVLTVTEDAPVRIAPTLEWPDGRLEGTANIELYFERRRRAPVS